MVQLWEGWREVENRQKWAQLWCALSSSLRLCEMWMSHWVLFRLGTMFGITKDRYLPEYLYDWESFASERNAMMWNKLEPGVLVQSGCKIFSGLLCLCWFKVIFCLELCTGCPVIWNLGVFLLKKDDIYGKPKPKPKQNPKCCFFFHLLPRLAQLKSVLRKLPIFWVPVLSKYSILALKSVPVAESVPDIRNSINTPFNSNLISFHLQRGCPDMSKIVSCFSDAVTA